jgi:hypothetical protein
MEQFLFSQGRSQNSAAFIEVWGLKCVRTFNARPRRWLNEHVFIAADAKKTLY